MDTGILVLVLLPPVLLLILLAAFAYVDAPNYGMNPTKWAAISFFVPLFGFFAYLFEREERTESPDRDMFVDGVFEIHESRADDTRLVEGGENGNQDRDTEESREDPESGWDARDR